MRSDAGPSVSSTALHTDKGLTWTCVRTSILSSRRLTSVQPTVGCRKHNLFFYYLVGDRSGWMRPHTEKHAACERKCTIICWCRGFNLLRPHLSVDTLPAASCLTVSSHYSLLHLQSSDGSDCVRRRSAMEPQRTNRLATRPRALGLASKSSWPFYCNNSLQRVTHFFWVLTSLTPKRVPKCNTIQCSERRG